MQSLLNIIVVNEPRMVPPRPKPGQSQFQVQDAECIVCDDMGKPVKVGVLRIAEDLRAKCKPGYFIGSFALGVSWKDRTIEAILTDLQEVTMTPKGPVPVALNGGLKA